MEKIKKKAVSRQPKPKSLSVELSTKSTCTQRPKTSPYIIPPVRIRIGAGYDYYVPRHLLQNLKWIASCSGHFMYQASITLLDVDESTGHVLVHYLYTGAYQTLDNMNTSSAEVNIEFKRAFSAYIMAKTYELAGLQQLAMHEIEDHSMKMNVFGIFEALSEDFSKLQDKSGWFQDYLKEKIKVAFEEDYTTFVKNDLFDHISNNALRKFVVRHVIQLYNSKLSRMLNTEQKAIQEFSEEDVPAAQYSTVEEAPVQEAFIDETVPADAVNDVSIERAPVTDEDPYGGDEWAGFGNKANKKKKEGVADTIDESIPEPAPDHEKLDEENLWSFSFGNAKNKENEKNGTVLIEGTFVNPEPTCEPAPEPELEATKEADFWRFEPFSTGKKTKKDEKRAFGESAAVIEDTSTKPEAAKEDVVWGFGSFSTGKKKKGKKDVIGESAAVIEDNSVNPELASEPVIEPEPEAAKEDVVWGFGSFSTGKKKKGKKNVIEESAAVIEDNSVNPELASEPVIEPEPEAAKEDVAWGFGSSSASKKKKGRKDATKIVENKPNMEELAPPPLEPAPLTDDGWGTSMMPDKKKKGKKSAKQKTLVTEPSSSHPELELGAEHESEKKDKLWDNWGTIPTLKKKSSKNKKEPKAIIAPADGELDDGPRKVKAIRKSNIISTASPCAEQEQVENGTSWALKPNNEEVEETRVSNSNDHSDFQAASEQPVKNKNKFDDGNLCPRRAKHLLEKGEQWKSCRPCRAVLCQVATQLATSMRYADEYEYEYEMVDHILMTG